MDSLVISLIAKHLDDRDLVMFALVNRATYSYGTHTNETHSLLIKPKTSTAHPSYRVVPSLLEDAKLQHCLRVLQDVKYLAKHKVPLSEYCTTVVMCKPCGTKITIHIGRVFIINTLMFVVDDLDALCEVQCDKTKPCKQVLCIHNLQCFERFRHKIYSIIQHTYTKVTTTTQCMKSTRIPFEDVKLTRIDGLVNVLRCCEHQRQSRCTRKNV